MIVVALVLIALPVALFLYAYLVYPVLLRGLSALRGRAPLRGDPAEWPFVSITLPAYNEEGRIAAALDAVLATDYPADRREVLVISDCSSDRTDEIVRGYAGRGVRLLRLDERRGKTAAENAAGHAVRGEIVVNTDASVRILPHSLKPLVRAFQDPRVGVASGRDVSVGDARAEGNQGESGYVGYEMWVRSLETRIDSIIGASGCFYGFRRDIYDTQFPEGLSRDFASALMAREKGYRAVSVDEAVCVVPRTASLRAEFRRKVRTMARGLQTLWFKRHLMNPLRHGLFAYFLLSHKLARWLVYVTLPGALVGLALLAVAWPPATILLGVALLGVALGVVGMRWPEGRKVPHVFAVPGFILASNVAGLLAWRKALAGEGSPTWEPTRRPA